MRPPRHPLFTDQLDPTATAAWKRLAAHARRLQECRLIDIVNDDPRRGPALTVAAPHMHVHLARQLLDRDALAALTALATELDIPGAARGMAEGAEINNTEGRAALHTALRSPGPYADVVRREQARMYAIATDVHSGSWRGHTGRPIRDVVHVGIGGSALGPQLVDAALRPEVPGALACHFADNIDADVSRELLARLDPETTLVVVVSKTFTTNETERNARTLRSWMLERGCSIAGLGRHFVAVSTNAQAMDAFGIPPQNRLAMWDWVGGRYSIWSAVHVSLAMCLGVPVARELLAGAAAMDSHFLDSEPARNAPLLLALTGVWNTNLLGCESHAVIPYSRRLALLPNYLQQLETESNGKRTRVDGQPVAWHTSPVVWGGEGTIGQHAFHQLLHQGTRAVSIDFILRRTRAGEPPFDAHDSWLNAHAIAQGEALLRGRSVAELGDDPLAAHRAMPGNRGSTTIVLDDVSPRALGALLALYEHKTFCAGAIWRINSFDQWGVELGKGLAQDVHAELQRGSASRQHDAATFALIRALLQ